MKITLYKPSEAPQLLTAEEFSDKLVYGGVRPIERVANLLGCPPAHVDVLAWGQDYIMYSVFDSDGALNLMATEVFMALTGAEFTAGWEANMLCGPLLVLCL